ncbi:MAG: exodeoxyribonuclease VII large subunit [Bacteroidales bacterium]
MLVLDQHRLNLDRFSRFRLTQQRDRLLHLEKRIQLADPERILARGYSLTLVNGKSLKNLEDLQPGAILETRLSLGTIESRVQTTKPKQEHGKSTEPEL